MCRSWPRRHPSSPLIVRPPRSSLLVLLPRSQELARDSWAPLRGPDPCDMVRFPRPSPLADPNRRHERRQRFATRLKALSRANDSREQCMPDLCSSIEGDTQEPRRWEARFLPALLRRLVGLPPPARTSQDFWVTRTLAVSTASRPRAHKSRLQIPPGSSSETASNRGQSNSEIDSLSYPF